jgi:hypothetical protein
MEKLKSIPVFENEAEERKKFRETRNSTDNVDWIKAERARFRHLEPSPPTSSLRDTAC